MIPNIGRMLQKQSMYDAQQNYKNQWRRARMRARDYYDGNTEGYTEEFFSESLLSKIPMARFGNPLDVANLVYFLSTDESSYITGQNLHINGGMLMV